MLAVTPVDPERMGRNGQLLREGAEALGVRHEPLRRNAGRCVQCSSCPHGCRLDAKRAMHVSYLPRAVAAGARVRAGVDVAAHLFARRARRRLECAVWPQRRARASASHAHRPPAPRRRARRRGVRHARAAAAIRVPLPERAARPEPADPSRLLGGRAVRRGGPRLGGRDAELRASPNGRSAGSCSRRRSRPSPSAPSGCPARRRAPAARARLRPDRLDGRAPLRPLIRAGRAWRATARCASPTASAATTRETLCFGIARAAELFYAAGAREVYPQISGHADRRARRHRAARGLAAAASRCASRPSTRWGRRGWTPTRSAEWSAPTARSTEPTGVYVADGSLLPSSIGVNPMMTIIAMASRVARQLAERLA